MEFKLEGLADAHTNVPTDAYTMAEAGSQAATLAAAARASGGALASSGSVLAQAGASNSAAGARSAGAAAIAGGRATLDTARAFEKRWHNWLYKSPDKQNFFLLITNALYLALTLTILVLTFLVVEEHVEDFKRNEFSQHRETVGGVNVEKTYAPCGMPTPDSMYLLQAIGALPAAGWDGASLEPDYNNWMKKVDRALCARIVPGKEEPARPVDLATCEAGGYVDYGTDHAEELLAIGYLMDDVSITPTLQDIDVQGDITAKMEAFERRTCLVKKESSLYPDEEPYYTEQQREAYGDLKTRVARAYIAAMPAFARYNKERATCAVPAEYKDPFDVDCKHSCHVRMELKATAVEQDLLYHYTADGSGGTMPPGTTFTKQLYRLLALSLAGYYDRHHNEGVCFRNTEVYTVANAPTPEKVGERIDALQFCEDSLGLSASGDVTTYTNAEAVAEYSKQDQQIESTEQCGDSAYSPPPPAPPTYRTDPSNGNGVGSNSAFKLSAQVCSAILQYGLFEQGRLFGIPDVLSPFVLDNRVDRSLHFAGAWVYNAMYVNPRKMAGDILADPKSKLELYIAYRLSSTSIWAILVANVAGYMMVRALAPMIVHILSLVGFTTNVIKYKDPGGPYGDTYEPIVLVRPQIGWPVYLAMIVTLLAIYWILWIDPATQSHYYVTPTCDDWHGLGVHVPSGAFGTTWGKRRYGRFGEHIIGILLTITLFLVVFIRAVGKTFVPYGAKKEAGKVEMGETVRIDAVALVMIGFALVIQILFITQSIVSGDAWYEAIKASDNDAAALDTFSKDVQMSIWAAFWTSASIGWFRQKWAVDKLNFILQFAWMGSALLLLWMPVFQSAVLLEKEIDTAFSDGKGSKDTNRLIIYIFIYGFSAIWTAVLGIRLKAMYDAMPERAAMLAKSSERVREAKEKKVAYLQGMKEAAQRLAGTGTAAPGTLNNISGSGSSGARLKFNLSGMQLGPSGIPVRPGRKTDAVYMPLMPKH